MLLLFSLCALAGLAQGQPPASAPGLLEKGHALYFRGDLTAALDAYTKAAKISSSTVQPWLNGAVVLEELGRRQEAVKWYARAAALSADPAALTALGWAQWRSGSLADAETTFARALTRAPNEPYTLLGLGRVELDLGRPKDAVKDFQRAAAAAPLLTVASYYEGKARERLGEGRKAAEAFKQSVIGDSYFAEGRDALVQVYLKQKSYNDAWKQVSRILDAEPRNRKFMKLFDRVTPLLTRKPGQLRPTGLALPIPYLADSPPGPLVPLLRVGLGTNPLGKPKPRQSMTFRATCDFDALDAQGGQRVLTGNANDTWEIRVKRIKKKTQAVLIDASGNAVATRKSGFVIVPRSTSKGIIALDPAAGPAAGAVGKLLRGRLEVTLFHGQLRLVNILDIENYTHGVVSAEMPIKSPIEALKAQAVVARSHALFIKKVTRRHRKQGYDVCDEQHCQVYSGARAESARSRDVVTATRGRVVTYKGQIAHVIYSSNCGGHTQSGKDLAGWGDVPYWAGIADAPEGSDPRSPWELRRWLAGWPPAFCKPSADVHASHFRWTRVMTFKDLEDKLERKLRIGKLKTLRTLRRSPSGNVNSLLIEGTRKRVKINSELQIRGLLGLGSLRSTQFVIDWEYDGKGKPAGVMFRGGGWGHGVGLCQSGAMGRADAGQTYEQIIKSYFKGTEPGQLSY